MSAAKPACSNAVTGLSPTSVRASTAISSFFLNAATSCRGAQNQEGTP